MRNNWSTERISLNQLLVSFWQEALGGNAISAFSLILLRHLRHDNDMFIDS